MRLPHRLAAGLAAVCFALGCSTTVQDFPNPGDAVPLNVREVLERPDTFTLLSMDPSPPREDLDPETSIDRWAITGEAVVRDPANRAQAVMLLYEAVRQSDGRAAMCFDPRHALRATKDGVEVAVLICFECLTIRVYVDGVREGGATISDRLERNMSELFARHQLTIAD